jgi:uncharacterized protein (TIGR02217 family)
MVEIQFPTDLSRGAQGGDTWDTQIAALPNGNEQRNARRALSLGSWVVAFNNRDKAKFQQIRNFFLATKGPLHAFRFKDWLDYESDEQQSCSPATGNGSNKDFQLQKSYTVPAPLTAYIRTITKPVSGTVRVYVNGVEVVAGWSVNTATGVVSFVIAPTAGHTVKATYEFDKVVRFEDDEADSSIEMYNIYTWNQINLREVPES